MSTSIAEGLRGRFGRVVVPGVVGVGIGLGYLSQWRPARLQWGATRHDANRPLPGDDLVGSPSVVATRAIDIDAPAEHVYPWIVQMGTGRGGWYSLDLIDNLGRPSAVRVHQHLQDIHHGQLIPMSPKGRLGMIVHDYEPEHWIVWRDRAGECTWAWFIAPRPDGGTRLITRLRLTYRLGVADAVVAALGEVGDAMVMRRCLIGIATRAEARRRRYAYRARVAEGRGLLDAADPARSTAATATAV